MQPRKPLVIFTPKSLLRNRNAVSQLKDFTTGTHFLPVIGAPTPAAAVRRVVLCSGKVYYDLLAGLGGFAGLGGAEGVALVRLEQLYPFPAETLQRELERFPNAAVIWCQEEPKNMGAWAYLDRKIEAVLRKIGNNCAWPHCVSRPENASTAIGTTDEHNADQAMLVSHALGLMEVPHERLANSAS
jgi:2-oxoglutarate dehydrogenase E1 component